jgi:hypothetical protein
MILRGIMLASQSWRGGISGIDVEGRVKSGFVIKFGSKYLAWLVLTALCNGIHRQ